MNNDLTIAVLRRQAKSIFKTGLNYRQSKNRGTGNTEHHLRL
jgi:hypothetical protein